MTQQQNKALIPHRLIGVGSYGGKYLPERVYDRLENAVCYCFGAGEDISFDAALARDGHEVFIFDPTPRAKIHFDGLMKSVSEGTNFGVNSSTTTFYDATPEATARMQFHGYGLWGANEVQKFYIPKNPAWVSHSILNLQKTNDYFEAPCKTLKTIMDELGHGQIDILKIDIEGAEYVALERMMADGIRPAIINVEYDEGHHQLDAGAKNRILESMRKLGAFGYAMTYQAGWDFTFLRIDLMKA